MQRFLVIRSCPSPSLISDNRLSLTNKSTGNPAWKLGARGHPPSVTRAGDLGFFFKGEEGTAQVIEG
ncbi:hypothetical protein Kisp02_27390 [Kineosporia sp. NBRC 101731]|nr:hypothetical protein Kisp02_27390 [Kineosporia sp. NBRC 101731]